MSFFIRSYHVLIDYTLYFQWTDPGPPPDNTEPVPDDEGAIEQEEDIFADTGAAESDDEEQGSTRPCNLHPDDPAHFMKLSSVLKAFFAQEITKAEVEKGDRELREYCLELMHVRTFPPRP